MQFRTVLSGLVSMTLTRDVRKSNGLNDDQSNDQLLYAGCELMGGGGGFPHLISLVWTSFRPRVICRAYIVAYVT